MVVKGRRRPLAKRFDGVWWRDLCDDEAIEFYNASNASYTFDRSSGRLVQSSRQPEWHVRLDGKSMTKRFWVLIASGKCVCCALQTIVGNVKPKLPLFGFWHFELSKEDLRRLPKVPLHKLLTHTVKGWKELAVDDIFLVGMQRYERRLAVMSTVGDSSVSNFKESDEMVTKTKSDTKTSTKTSTKDSKRSKVAKKEQPEAEPKTEPKTERKATLARFLYNEVFIRSEVGTDEEIIEECRALDFCSQKFLNDDASAKSQLAWHKNRYRKGEFPGADPNTEYDVLQEFPSDAKRDRALEGDDAPEKSKRASKKKKTGKKQVSTGEITEMSRRQLKKLVKEYSLDIDPKDYDELEDFQEVVGEEMEDL